MGVLAFPFGSVCEFDLNSFDDPSSPYVSRSLLHHLPRTEEHEERMIIQYARRTFTGFQSLPRSPKIPPITEAQAEALDALHFLAEKYSLALDFQKGDIDRELMNTDAWKMMK